MTYFKSGLSRINDLRTINKKSDSIDRSWTSSMMMCCKLFSWRSPIRERGLAYGDLIERGPLATTSRPPFKHAQSDTVRHICQSSVPGNIALQPNRIANQRIARADGIGRVSQFPRNTLSKGYCGYPTRFRAVHSAVLSLR